LDQVTAHEAGPLEHGVVELASAHDVGSGRDDERAGLEPFSAEDRVARGRDRHDDVVNRGIAVALAGVRSDALAERGETLRRPAERDDALDRRNRRPDARDLRLRLKPAADDAEAARARLREMPSRNAARSTRSQLAKGVRLEHGDERRALGVEQ